MPMQDILVKDTEPLRIAESTGHVLGFGTENIAPVFRPLFQQVFTHLKSTDVKPGINIARYSEPAEDGSVQLHVGFDIGDQDAIGTDEIQIVELASAHVVSVIHQGSMDTIADSFDALIRWCTDSGYSLDGTSRELYVEWHEEDPSLHITELQLPVRLNS